MDTLKGQVIKGKTRPNQQFSQGRVCAKKGCDTQLSRYNRREYCNIHAPVKFPRVRGRVLSETH